MKFMAITSDSTAKIAAAASSAGFLIPFTITGRFRIPKRHPRWVDPSLFLFYLRFQLVGKTYWCLQLLLSQPERGRFLEHRPPFAVQEWRAASALARRTAKADAA